MTDVNRARGALLGLAVGDALGLPADFHRSIRHAWSRGALWRGSAALDDQRVSRPLLPFSVTLDDIAGIAPTDDTETAVVAALVLLGTTDHTAPGLFPGWLEHFGAEDAWCGVAARSAVMNAGQGLGPPATGNDNPAHYDDSAIPAGVAIGIAYAGRPDDASRVAAEYASITNTEDGIWAAQWAAICASALVAGAALQDALADAGRAIPAQGWLADNMRVATAIVDAGGEAFDALPELISSLSPRNYSHGGVAPETIPLAYAILSLAGADPTRAIPLALSIARKSDSLPALVGALCGAAGGEFAPRWSVLDEVRGVLLPSTAGVSLREIAQQLLSIIDEEKP